MQLWQELRLLARGLDLLFGRSAVDCLLANPFGVELPARERFGVERF
jgi:hypothetical protein